MPVTITSSFNEKLNVADLTRANPSTIFILAETGESNILTSGGHSVIDSVASFSDIRNDINSTTLQLVSKKAWLNVTCDMNNQPTSYVFG